MVYSIILWIVLGAIVGAIATKLVDLRGDSPIIGLAAAIGGSVVAGLIYRFTSGNLELWSILGLVSAFIGAAAGVGLFHVIRARSISRDRQTVRSSY